MSIIILNTAPSEFLTPPTPLFRAFKSDKEEIKTSAKVGMKPSAEVITLELKNYADEERYSHLTDFRLSYRLEGDDFLQVLGLAQDEPVIGASKTFSLDYYNFPQITEGNYEANLTIAVLATNTNTGLTEQLDELSIEPILQVNGMDLTLSEEHLFVTHVKDGVPSWSGAVDVFCSDVWTMLNSDQENNSALLINDSDEQHWMFAGDETLSFSLSPDVNELPLGYHVLSVYFYQPSLVAELKIHLIVTDASGLSVSPSRLDFQAIRYFQEAESKYVHIHPNSGLTISNVPSWLTVLEETFMYVSGTYSRLNVKPIASQNLLPGVYEAVIRLEFPGETKNIPVRHVVYGEWNVDYDKDVHFTRDNEILEIFSQSTESTYVRLSGEIKVYNYDGSERTFTREWSLDFVSGKAEINLGRELDDYLELFDEPILPGVTNLKQCYKPMSIKITAREIRYEDEQIVAMYRLPYQYFLRGRRPFSTRESFWLSHSPTAPVRVTANSETILNVFKGYGTPTGFHIKRNGELYRFLVWSSGANYAQPAFMNVRFLFSSIPDLEAGEVISIVYGNVQRDFIVIPPQRNSMQIFWVSQWETMEMFEFTGEFELPVDYNHDATTKFRKWKEIMKKIENNKTQKFVVNTGWIFKENIRIIDDLISSKKAFLKIADPGRLSLGQEWFVELVPISKKMAGHDSKANLYQFEVEFQINRKHEDAIYL